MNVEASEMNGLKVTISILTYNRAPVLKELLMELRALTYRPLEIIVVDNCSADDTRKMIRSDFEFVRYFRTSENLGAVARNIGMENAEGDVIITLDDDISGIKDEDLVLIGKVFRDRPTLGAVNFKVVDFFSGNICNWVHHCDVEKFSETEFYTYEITEGAVAFKKRAIQIAGGYPTSFFLSHEGPDLAFRLIDNGFDVIYSNKIAVLHSHSDMGRKSWLNYYYDTRNQLWLAIRHFPPAYAIKYLARGWLSMFVYSVRDGFFLYWLKGIIDSIKNVPVIMKNRKVLTKKTMSIINRIDKKRPNIYSLIKTRLVKKGVRL